MLANLLLSALPSGVGSRLRAIVYRRLVGFQIGKGTTFPNKIEVIAVGNPYDRLIIGENCRINACRLILNESLIIGDNVVVSREVILTTDSHSLGPSNSRMGSIVARPIRIENGVWITQRSIIHGGVTIGEGSVVANNSVVTKDVGPNTLVGGVPARVVKRLSGAKRRKKTSVQESTEG